MTIHHFVDNFRRHISSQLGVISTVLSLSGESAFAASVFSAPDSSFLMVLLRFLSFLSSFLSFLSFLSSFLSFLSFLSLSFFFLSLSFSLSLSLPPATIGDIDDFLELALSSSFYLRAFYSLLGFSEGSFIGWIICIGSFLPLRELLSTSSSVLIFLPLLFMRDLLERLSLFPPSCDAFFFLLWSSTMAMICYSCLRVSKAALVILNMFSSPRSGHTHVGFGWR